MNSRQLINALIVLVILTVVSFFVFRKDKSSWKQGDDTKSTTLIKKLNVNLVSGVSIRTPKGTLELKKNDNGKWMVSGIGKGYPADFSKLSSLLLRIKDMEVTQMPRVLHSQFSSLKLISPIGNSDTDSTGIQLTLTGKKGETLFSMIAGAKHFPEKDNSSPVLSAPEPDGRYILLSGKKQPLLIHDPFKELVTDPLSWIDRTFVKMADIVSIELADSQGKKKWRIYRHDVNEPWTLDGLKKTEKPLPRPMMEATSVFGNIDFDNVYPAPEHIETFQYILTLITQHGQKYKMKINPSDKKVFLSVSVSSVTAGNLQKQKNTPQQPAAEESLQTDKFYSEWVYEFPLYKLARVLKDRRDFYRPIAPQKQQLKKLSAEKPD